MLEFDFIFKIERYWATIDLNLVKTKDLGPRIGILKN